MIYIECPHCHAIFSLPVGLEKLPERVRCGECSTVFIPEIDSQAEERPSEKIEASPSTALSLEDFLTGEHAGTADTEPEAPTMPQQQVEETLQDFNNYLTGDHYPAEPETELPDLNLLSSSVPEIDDPLKDQQQRTEADLVSEAFAESPDDESADLISDRFEADTATDVDSDIEDASSEIENSELDGLPEIRDELVTQTTQATQTSLEEASEQDSAGNAAYEKFKHYLESVNVASDSPEDEQHSITSEISAFIDEIDEEPENLYSADHTETEIERRFLDLDDDAAETGEADFSADHEPEQTDFVERLEEQAHKEDMPDAARQSSLLPDDDEATSEDESGYNPELSDPFVDEVASLELEVPEEFRAADISEQAAKPAWPYVGGGILLILLLALQYVYTHREEFATYPETRGLVSSLCRITGCEIEPQKDLGAVHLLNHAVYAHPAKENALIIKALIRNRAEFPQPYPIIELTLADLNDNRVALRRFGPGEYLADKPKENDLMPVNINIPVQLQVLDPGQNAVAFEFDFL